ncbi:Panacea domain-containing protein [Orrella dioscoreae]|uniref:Panacea domain-containing protein n=1 Tax=Orrella dioscoreae TaxID=1851544 RepID=UPI00082CD42F|nr:Panacea domain-containing protein [Orrella dioscoreae]
MFDEQRIAQAAGYFLHQRGGRMSYLKLMKLLYLADRESLARHGSSISGDEYFSLNNGPVLSRTLNLISGMTQSEKGGWETWVSDKDKHEVSLGRHVESIGDFDELSKADIEVLSAVWAKFGHMTRWQIRDFTHDQRNVPEWENPNGSRKPIAVRSILQNVGRSPEQIEDDIRAQSSRDAMDQFFDSIPA